MSLNKILTLLMPTILIIILLFVLQNQKQYETEKQDKKEEIISTPTITLEGRIDTRLYVIAYNRYEPTIYKGKECTMKSGWSQGGGPRPRMDVIQKELIPDINKFYKVHLPIIYTGEKKCGYVYKDTFINISRDKNDPPVKITILNTSNEYSHQYRAHAYDKNGQPYLSNLYAGKEGDLDWNKYYNLQTPMKFYRISNGSKINCYTDYFEKFDVVIFSCLPEYSNNINGIDIIESDTINFDILVSDNRNTFYSENGEPKKGYFIDYKEQLHMKKRNQSLKSVVPPVGGAP